MRHKIIKTHLNDHNVHNIYKKINTCICFDFETLKVGLASNIPQSFAISLARPNQVYDIFSYTELIYWFK